MFGQKSVRFVNKGDLIEVSESLRALLLSSEGKEKPDLTTLKLKENKGGYFLLVTRDWTEPLCMLTATLNATLQDLHSEIKTVLPTGSSEHILYSYIDRDNEIIRITSDAELKEAYQECIFDGFLVINLSENRKNGNYNNSNNNNLQDNKYKSPKGLLEQICTICKWSLPGTAFVCLQCKDFIVCESCEIRCSVNSIHPAHIFAKVRNDIQLQSLQNCTPLNFCPHAQMERRSSPLTITKVVEMTISLLGSKSMSGSMNIEEQNRMEEDVFTISIPEEEEVYNPQKDESDYFLLLELQEAERDLQLLSNMGFNISPKEYNNFNGDIESIIEAYSYSRLDTQMESNSDSDF